jgi:hypothetical protein
MKCRDATVGASNGLKIKRFKMIQAFAYLIPLADALA